MLIISLLSVTLLISTAIAVLFVIKQQKQQVGLISLENELSKSYEENGAIENRLNLALQEKNSLQAKLETYLTERTQAVSQLESAKDQLAQAIQERDHSATLAQNARDLQYAAEKKLELIRQQNETMQKRMEDWEETNTQSLKAAKEAMFETGTQVMRKEAEAVTEKTLEELQKIIKSMGSLHDKVHKNEDKVENVLRALTSPIGAGQLSEIGLENSLKGFGLEAGRDFVMQYSVSGEKYGRSLRPDSVVFLPAGTILVIDSKASKFFLELAEAEGTENEKATLDKLKATMHEHLKSLASKGYKDAIKDYMRSADNEEEVRHIITVMFLYSEAAVEKLEKADSSFRHKARELGIIISGPTGLAGLLSLAQVEISRAKQEKNYQTIIDELSGLLGYMETAIDLAHKVGKGIRSAAENYHKFTKSVNGRLLPRGRKLVELGIELPKNKQIPDNLPEYHIITDTAPLIEGEATKEEKKKLELLES